MNQSEQHTESLSRPSSRKPILLGVLIFVSGFIVGAGLMHILTGSPAPRKRLPPGPEYMSSRMVERIVRELNLSPAQHEQLQPIMQNRLQAMDEIRKQARPQINTELKLMNEEILAILDPAQQQLWQDKMKKMQDHFTRMRQHRGSGGRWRGSRDPNNPQRRQRRFENRPPEDRPFPPDQPAPDAVPVPEETPPQPIGPG